MTSRKKASECGWFYHAPAPVKKSDEPVAAPAPSQIPGLSDLAYEEEEQPRLTNLRDTDTKYIRMAKQGGRPDLLQMKNLPSPSKEAQGYPRCDWYYLEDNAVADNVDTPAEKYPQFFTPLLDSKFYLAMTEYMVHKPRQHCIDLGSHDGSDPNSRYNKRSPYAFDKLTAYEREAANPTDKMVMKIPEAKKFGYGVRQGKKVPVKKTAAPPERVKPVTTSQMSSLDNRPKYQPMPEPKESEISGTQMSTLLSYGYEREWHSRLQRWQDKQSKARETLAVMRSPDGPPPGSVGNASRTSSGKSRGDEGEKELFKLSRFKNIPPRVDDHQKPELLKTAAVH